MKTDGTNVWFTTFDLKLIRRHKANNVSNAQEMVRKLVKQGLATVEKQGVTNQIQMNLDKFLFYCVPGYLSSEKAHFVEKLFKDK